MLCGATLAAAGADPGTPVEGVDEDGYFARRRCPAATTSAAILLECANMPPYRDALATQVGLPVFDAAQVIAWFHAGLPGATQRYGRSDLW